MLYLRARYAQPSSGTFLTKDPFEGHMQRAMSRNGYTYVEGNPVNLTDPSGKFVPLLGLAAAAAAGAIGGAVLGFGSGQLFGREIHRLMASGACGCGAQQYANEVDVNTFAMQLALDNILPGAVLGGLAATGPIGLGAASLVGGWLSANGAAEALGRIYGDIRAGNETSACDRLGLALGFLGTVAAGVVGRLGYNNWLKARLQRLQSTVAQLTNGQNANTQLVWNRILNASEEVVVAKGRPTNIPKFFELEINDINTGTRRLFVTANATEHLGELVLRNHTSTTTGTRSVSPSMIPLRSQIVLLEFVTALDEAAMNGSFSWKEVLFRSRSFGFVVEESSTLGNLPPLTHAQPISPQ